MRVDGTTRVRTRAQLPPEVRGSFEVYLNGVLQQEGTDYRVEGDGLVFERELREEGALGLKRWTSMLLGIAGTYKQDDSVDVVYTAAGRRAVAAKLPLEPVS